jgi:hypothetical protein
MANQKAVARNLKETFDQTMKTVLMYKQLVALSKNKEDSDEEEEEQALKQQA